jgi:hypothetical protein
MLIRQDWQDPQAVWTVTQPAHGWVAGQLARVWGNATFGSYEPKEEVCLATEQHDTGWAAWDSAPTLDPQTGRPHTFLTVPLDQRLGIWHGAAERLVLPQSRYAALLVSIHASRLHQSSAAKAPEEARRLRALLDDEGAFQEDLQAALRADPVYAPFATPEVVGRNYALLSTCDWLSLILCRRFAGPPHDHQEDTATLERVPTAGDETTLALRSDREPGQGEGNPNIPHVRVDPWPFGVQRVALVWEERLLRGTFEDEQVMRQALRRAPAVTRTLHLHPGSR